MYLFVGYDSPVSGSFYEPQDFRAFYFNSPYTVSISGGLFGSAE